MKLHFRLSLKQISGSRFVHSKVSDPYFQTAFQQSRSNLLSLKLTHSENIMVWETLGFKLYFIVKMANMH